MDDLVPFVWLSLSALAAGAVNSLAGGGTLLTFPALVASLSELEPEQALVVANVTSTVALVPGSLAGAWGYRNELRPVRHWLWLLSGPSLVGGVIGALLVTSLNPRYFAFLVPWLTLGAALLFLVKPWLTPSGPDATNRPPSRLAQAAILLFQFLVGIYGGYFGAGIGILMLGALSIMGLPDVHQMNSLKTLLAALINGAAVVVFVVGGQVVWSYALVMAVAAIIGGYLGAHGSRYLPPWLVRWVVIGVGFGLSAYFFCKQWSGTE